MEIKKSDFDRIENPFDNLDSCVDFVGYLRDRIIGYLKQSGFNPAGAEFSSRFVNYVFNRGTETAVLTTQLKSKPLEFRVALNAPQRDLSSIKTKLGMVYNNEN